MKCGKCAAAVLAALTLILFGFPGCAYAYLDPGTGSYLLQIALAAIVGTLFAIRLFWSRIKSFFKNLLSQQEKEEPDEGRR